MVYHLYKQSGFLFQKTVVTVNILQKIDAPTVPQTPTETPLCLSLKTVGHARLVMSLMVIDPLVMNVLQGLVKFFMNIQKFTITVV